MTDKFTDSMEVAEVGDLRPSSIGGECCENCWNDTRFMRGVLIEGVTPEAANMLYKKCEILPAGTAEEIERLRKANAVMLETLGNIKVEMEWLASQPGIDSLLATTNFEHDYRKTNRLHYLET